jgi:hypothetical protein
MDAARVTQALLEAGLTIHSAMRHGRFVVKVTGGKTPSVGVGATFYKALQRASWRWTQGQPLLRARFQKAARGIIDLYVTGAPNPVKCSACR